MDTYMLRIGFIMEEFYHFLVKITQKLFVPQELPRQVQLL